MFSLICAWRNGWVNNGEAGHLRRQRGHYDVTVMIIYNVSSAGVAVDFGFDDILQIFIIHN